MQDLQETLPVAKGRPKQRKLALQGHEVSNRARIQARFGTFAARLAREYVDQMAIQPVLKSGKPPDEGAGILRCLEP